MWVTFGEHQLGEGTGSLLGMLYKNSTFSLGGGYILKIKLNT